MVGYISIGQRIAIIRRRRGLSQAVVAGRLGRSVQWLSMIERGVRSADRYSILVPIADVLRVSVAELTGKGRADDAAPATEHEAARLVRLVLAECGFAGTLLGLDRGTPAATDIERLDRRVRDAWTLVHDARYHEASVLLPDLVRECERAARMQRPARRDAYRLLAELYQAVAAMMA